MTARLQSCGTTERPLVTQMSLNSVRSGIFNATRIVIKETAEEELIEGARSDFLPLLGERGDKTATVLQQGLHTRAAAERVGPGTKGGRV